MGDIKETIAEVESTLGCCLKTYIDNGVANADSCQVRETSAAIKDLAEAKYYCTVTEAMEKGEEYPYGYSQPHYPGGTVGRMTSGNMGYPGWNDIYGYNPTGYNGRGNSGNYGYHDDHMYKPMVDQEPYIQDYINWKDAKRHYTETHSAADKNKLDEHMEKHFNNIIDILTIMYKDSDISTKRDLKENITAFANGLQ